jgi:group I intron endonuclease
MTQVIESMIVPTGYIYLIRNMINGKCYVGLTRKTISNRWNSHLRRCKSGNHSPLYDSIRKYGIANFCVDILEEIEYDFLQEREIFYIDKLQTHVSTGKGYNQTFGGEGVVGHSGWHHTESAKIAIGIGNSKKVRSDETKEKIRISVKKAMTPAVIDNIKRKTKEALKDPTRRQAIREKNSKKVEQLSLEGDLIACYDSARIASTVTGVNHGNLCSCCRGKSEKTAGYKWRYVILTTDTTSDLRQNNANNTQQVTGHD